MKRAILFVITIIILLIFLIILTPYIKKPETSLPSSESVSQTAVFETVTLEEKTDFAELKLSYPKLPPGQYTEVSQFVASVQGEHAQNIRDAEAFAQEFGGGAMYQTILTYAIATSTNTTTFVFQLYTYTGGAHGNTAVLTFTYKNSDRTLVTLKDVFTDATYLRTISAQARTYLYASLGEQSTRDQIDLGTEPNTDNFNAWYMTNDTITFIFGQYQVGPYVIGMPEFPLSKKSVSSIVRPDFQ